MSRALRFAALALLIAACHGRAAPPPGPAARPGSPEPGQAAGSAPEAPPVEPAPQAQSAAAAAGEEPVRAPADLAVGLSRRALLSTLGRCARRAEFLPGKNGGVTVEVFQPASPDCVKRFGARQFVVTAGKSVTEIRPGLLDDQAPPPPRSDVPR